MTAIHYDYSTGSEVVTHIADDCVPAMIASIGVMLTNARAIGRAAPTETELMLRLSPVFSAGEIARYFDRAYQAAGGVDG